MKKLLICLCSILFLFGCQPRETVEVPVIPHFKYAITESGEPWIVTPSEIFDKVRLLVEEMEPTQFPKIYINDAKYVVVDHEWMLELIKWWDHLKWSFGIEYVAEGFDCDNFADFLASVVDFANMKGDRIEAEIIVGKLSVFQREEFGGVEAGSKHALNFFSSNEGLFVLEPQGARSTVIEYHKYPNVKYISEIKLN